MNKESPKSNKSETHFLGINFSNFFKSCGGCCAGERDDVSVSSHGGNNALQRKKQSHSGMATEGHNQNAPVSEHASSAHDWMTDFDDFVIPDDPNLKVPDVYETYENPEEPLECPQEPLDMDYLRQLSKESSDGDHQVSDISHHSKKIGKGKTAKPAKGTKKKEAAEPVDAKNRNKRRPWQPHEDAKVLELVGRYGQSWALIASMLDGRTGKQIRDRFLNKLRPNIKKGDWAQSEDQLLLSLYYQIGHKWSKIATYLPGRTEGQVKNRFYSHIKKKILKEDVTSEPQETQTSPSIHLKQEASPDRTNKTGYDLNQMTFNQAGFIEQSTSPMSYSTQPTSHNRQVQEPTDFISYQNGNYNGQGYHQQQANGGYTESMGSPDSYINYNTAQFSNERDIDAVIFKATNYYDHPSTSGSVTEGENLTNIDKLDRIDHLNKRKKNLEYLLFKTMQDINTNNPQYLQNFNPNQYQNIQNAGGY